MTKPRRRSLAPVRIDQLAVVTGGGAFSWVSDAIDAALTPTEPDSTNTGSYGLVAPRRDAQTIYY